MARPTKCDPWISEEGLKRIEGWALDGLTDEEIARHKMGIAPSTLYAWQRKHPEIKEAIRRGKAPVDIDVEHAVYKSAIGYTVVVKKPIKLKREIGKPGGPRKIEEVIEYAEEEVHVPANPLAQKFWLMSRKPDRWRDAKARVDLTVNNAEGEAILVEVRELMGAANP